MAGLLEYLIASLGERAQQIPGVTMPGPDDMLDPAAEAEAARVAAAAKLARRRGVPESPLDTAQWPAGPANAPGPAVGGDQPSPLDSAEWPAGPSGAPRSMLGVLGSMGMPGMLSGKGFSTPYDDADPAGVAQAAREAAAARTKNGVVRRSAFDGGATAALPFAGMLSASGLQNSMRNPTSAAGDLLSPPPSPAPDLPPSTNDPQAQEPVVFEDGVPLPRPRPDSGLNGQPGGGNAPAVDAPPVNAPAPMSLAPPLPATTQEMSARPAVPGAPLPIAPVGAPSAAPPALPAAAGSPFMDGLKGLLGKIIDPDKAATYMALGSGFSGAPSFGTGLSRASAAAVPAMAADRANAIKQGGIAATYRALIDRKVPPAEALAAVYNPDVMKAVASKYFETKPLQHFTVKDALGAETVHVFDPNTGKVKAAEGGGEGTGAASAAGSLLAPGVKYDPNLTGQEYFDQFSKDVQAAAKAYINGDVMPTGNARQKSMATYAKQLAQRYGLDMGIPVSDELYAKKRKMQVDLASSGPSSMGGILSNGKSAFGHLANLGDKLVDLGSLNGPDIPFGGAMAEAGNRIGTVAATSATKGKITAVNDNAMKYGQEATKFYAGTGGGVEERLAGLKTLAPEKTSGKEQAAFLETEKQLMLERIHQKELQVVDVLGEDYLARHPIRTPDLQRAIDKIDQSVAVLRGDKAAPKSSGQLAPGDSRSIDGVTIRRIN